MLSQFSSFSSMLVALLLMIAGATVLVMIEMTGKREDGQREKKKKIRRVLGYLLFFFLFLLVFLLLNNAGGFSYPDEGAFSWGGVHIILALFLLALVLVKLLLIKLDVQGGLRLILLGIILFGFIFTLIGVTIGYYIFIPSGAGSIAEAKMGWATGAVVSDQDLMGKNVVNVTHLSGFLWRIKRKRTGSRLFRGWQNWIIPTSTMLMQKELQHT